MNQSKKSSQSHKDNKGGKGNNISRINRVAITLLVVLVTALVIFVVVNETRHNQDAGNTQAPQNTDGIIAYTPSPQTDAPQTTEPTIEPTETPLTYKEITVLSAGDIMFHMPQINGALDSTTGKYDFNDNFQFVKNIVSAADLAVVNFETTLADTNYSGYPAFCAPVSTLDAIKNAGFDTLLFANNHCYDRGLSGLLATLNHFTENGFDYIGATTDTTKPSYLVKDVNGVKLGLMNYSDSITGDNGSFHTINGRTITPATDFDYMNLFVRGSEDAFYARVASDIEALNSLGVDMLIMYIHWGNEYYLQNNEQQRAMAQALCDLGIDVIIGSHPHVIQPMESFVSTTDPTHSTVCFYSLGNFISNQNRLSLTTPTTKEYTENGLMVTLTIRSYSDGQTVVANIDYTPTWVHRYIDNTGYYAYNIIPLPVSESDANSFLLNASSFGLRHATEAYNMTDTVFRTAVDAFNSKAAASLR